jgi:hypothetical protein
MQQVAAVERFSRTTLVNNAASFYAAIEELTPIRSIGSL